MKKKFILFISLVILAASWTSCEKLMTIDPPEDGNLEIADSALQTTADMQALLNSTYDIMANAYYGNQQNLSELLSDNLESPYNHDDYNEVYIRNTLFFNGTIGNFYRDPYQAIMRVNTMFDNFDRIQDLTPEDKLRFEAEGRFVRALNHYEDLQLFAQPYGFTPDNSHLGIVIRKELTFDALPRASVNDVYNFIIEDLEFAENNLSESNVINGVPYADKWAVKAMLARVYFQMNNFEKASEYASDVIDNGPFVLDSLNARWSADISTENIFTLLKNINYNNNNNLIGNYRSDNNDLPTLRAAREYYEPLYVAGLDATPFDLRKNWFTIKEANTSNYFYAVSRFDADFLNIPFLHLTEIMLIRAESNAELGVDLASAIADLNKIKERAGIALLGDGSTPIIIIEHAQRERKKELIGEGRYAYDLKRRGANGENIMVRNAPWDCDGMILQFPVSENTSNFIMNETGGCN